MIEVKLLGSDPVSRPTLIVRKSVYLSPNLIWKLVDRSAVSCIRVHGGAQAV